jgi:hypothetical protein
MVAGPDGLVIDSTLEAGGVPRRVELALGEELFGRHLV